MAACRFILIAEYERGGRSLSLGGYCWISCRRPHGRARGEAEGVGSGSASGGSGPARPLEMISPEQGAHSLVASNCRQVSKLRQPSRMSLSFGNRKSVPSVQALFELNVSRGMPDVEPIRDWQWTSSRSHVGRPRKSEEKILIVLPIQIGPISATSNVRTDSGSGGKADER